MSDYQDKYVNYSPVDICEMIGQPYRKTGNYCITGCYNASHHKNGDRKPSMAVYGYERGYYCFACGESGTNSWLLKQFGSRDDNYQPKIIDRPVASKTEQDKVTSSSEYTARLLTLYESLPELTKKATELLESKALFADMFDELETLSPNMEWKWHTNQVRGWGEGIFIPYVFQGKMITARLRRLNAKENTPRFLSMPGNTMWPYNLDAIMRYKRVFVTEGETDCLTMNMMGLPAVGIPGATSGKAIDRLIEQAQIYLTQLIVVPDNDPAGEAFAERIRLAGIDARVAVDVANVPYRKDINEWYLNASKDEINRFLERYQDRKPYMANSFVDEIKESEIQDIESWNQLAVSL